MEPNTSGPCILQYASIVVSFRHSAVSRDIDRLHADIWQHVEVEGDAAVGAGAPAGDPKLDAHEPHFVVRKEVLLASALELVVQPVLEGVGTDTAVAELVQVELVVEPEGAAFVAVHPLLDLFPPCSLSVVLPVVAVAGFGEAVA